MKINDPNYQRKCYRLPRRPVAKLIGALVLLGVFSACTDELEENQAGSRKGTTATLELSLSVPPMLETKAVVCEADSGSEARKAGFYYEMQVLTTDTTATDSIQVATKAAASLKNVYAFLFTSTGAFNGRASVGSVGVNTDISLVFTNVSDAAATNGRLVIIANDASATVDYSSSTDFASFSGTYAGFQNLTLTSGVTSDVNIPYVGSETVSLSDGGFTTVSTVRLYRMLGKIVLTNNTFSITGGPSRNAINLYKAGKTYFGTPNNYDGTGSSVTASGRYLTTATAGSNVNSNTWYVGENVRTTVTNAAYIELGTGVVSATNTNPSVGQEYISSGGYAFTYKVYLTNFALRRNNVYNVTVNVSGTFAKHLELAATSGSNVSVESTVVHGGLNIGKFGGASGYIAGAGFAPTISGSYTKNLLLQPNTSGSTAMDNVRRKWSDNTTTLWQSETRKYWDRTYTLAHIDKTVGLAYEYCNSLTIGGVPVGTWYLPTEAQLMAMWGILRGIQENSSYAYYSAFYAGDYYWSSSEDTPNEAWSVNFSTSKVNYTSKTNSYYVRCVRDLP